MELILPKAYTYLQKETLHKSSAFAQPHNFPYSGTGRNSFSISVPKTPIIIAVLEIRTHVFQFFHLIDKGPEIQSALMVISRSYS